MDFNDFLNLFNGTLVDFDNYYGNQCVDLVQFWSRVIGGPRFTGDAYQIYNEAGDFFIQIPNTPDGVPQKGDIVVWDLSYNGTAGHIGIATGTGDTNTFDAFEQNDPLNSNCHVKTYNYNSVLGWLRPKVLPQNQQDLMDGLRKERDTNWNLYQNEIETTKSLNFQLADVKKALDECKSQSSIVTVQVPTASAMVTSTNTSASTQPTQASGVTPKTEVPPRQSNPLPQNVQNTSPSGPGGFTAWLDRLFHSIFGS